MLCFFVLSLTQAQLISNRAAGEVAIDEVRNAALFEQTDCNDNDIMCFTQPLNCNMHERNCLTVKLR